MMSTFKNNPPPSRKVLSHLALHLAGDVPSAVHQVPGHENVEESDDAKRHRVEYEEPADQDRPWIIWPEFRWIRIAGLRIISRFKPE